jgi:hypothetical protein
VNPYQITAVALLALPTLWVFFLAYAGLKANWKTLRIEVKIVGALVVLVGFALDVAINWTIGLALGVTKDFTLSQKCKRLGRGNGWQADVAAYLCTNWLNPFDSGHC